MSNKINVILVDDHEMVRLGLKSFLNLQGDVEVVGEAEMTRWEHTSIPPAIGCQLQSVTHQWN